MRAPPRLVTDWYGSILVIMVVEGVSTRNGEGERLAPLKPQS